MSEIKELAKHTLYSTIGGLLVAIIFHGGAMAVKHLKG